MAKATPTEIKVVKKVIRIVKKMDAPEADAMGVSCQHFADTLIKELKEKFDA